MGGAATNHASAAELELVTPQHVPANDEQPTSDAVLDVEDVVRLLRVSRNTVYELVGRNEIPSRRIGKQIRFSRAAIMRWLDPWSAQGARAGR